MREVYDETTPANPVFFVLFPGVNPYNDVESLGKQLGYTEAKDPPSMPRILPYMDRYHITIYGQLGYTEAGHRALCSFTLSVLFRCCLFSVLYVDMVFVPEAAGSLRRISMGQGQEEIADRMIDTFADSGGWVFLEHPTSCPYMVMYVPWEVGFPRQHPPYVQVAPKPRAAPRDLCGDRARELPGLSVR
jgi:hypothetical protein